jgi:hypothetical protein
MKFWMARDCDQRKPVQKWRATSGEEDKIFFFSPRSSSNLSYALIAWQKYICG